MYKVIKDFSPKHSKLEMAGRNFNRPTQEGGFRNQNQYRRGNNPPQILQRENRNNDPEKIQAPFQNNYVEETEELVDARSDQDINFIGNEQSAIFLTQFEYEDALAYNHINEIIEESISLSNEKYLSK